MPAMSQRPEYVIGAMGDHLTLETLPSPNTVRWTPWCKAEVVAAVRGGLLSFDEACARYSIEMEELIGWQRSFDRSGVAGLRVTRMQRYRDQYERQDR